MLLKVTLSLLFLGGTFKLADAHLATLGAEATDTRIEARKISTKWRFPGGAEIDIKGTIRWQEFLPKTNFNCPSREQCSAQELLRLGRELPVMVMDAGHNDEPGSNRTDWAKVKKPGVEKEEVYGLIAGDPLPGKSIADLKKAESESGPGVAPDLHEGKGTLNMAVLAKVLFDECISTALPPIAKPRIALSRNPGEQLFGDYITGWREHVKAYTGQDPYIGNDVGVEHVNKRPGENNNGNYNFPQNHRAALINYLALGAPPLLPLSDPNWKQSFSEFYPKGILPSDAKDDPRFASSFVPAADYYKSGIFVSFHSETANSKDEKDPKDSVSVYYRRIPPGQAPMVSDFFSKPQKQADPVEEKLGDLFASEISQEQTEFFNWVKHKREAKFNGTFSPMANRAVPAGFFLLNAPRLNHRFLIEVHDNTGIARNTSQDLSRKAIGSMDYTITRPGRSPEKMPTRALLPQELAGAKGYLKGLIKKYCESNPNET